MKIRINRVYYFKNGCGWLLQGRIDDAGSTVFSVEMNLTLAHIGTRFPSKDAYEGLTHGYIDRVAPFLRCETAVFKTKEALLDSLARAAGRTQAVLVLLDSSGRQMTSAAFAEWMRAHRDGGTQSVVFAIGPADGWDQATLGRAHLVLSLGPLTFAHQLARLVMAEQLYRACTILAGHPYHTGH